MVVIILLTFVGIAAMFLLVENIACVLAAPDEDQLPESADLKIEADKPKLKRRKKASHMMLLSAT